MDLMEFEHNSVLDCRNKIQFGGKRTWAKKNSVSPDVPLISMNNQENNTIILYSTE